MGNVVAPQIAAGSAAVPVGVLAAAVAGCSGGMLPEDTAVLQGESAVLAGSIAAATSTSVTAGAGELLALASGISVLTSDCDASAVDSLVLAHALAIAVSE
ncbi:TPA: hypothetical protein ACH3X1_013065 [Trebouxia sp. C0004]